MYLSDSIVTLLKLMLAGLMPRAVSYSQSERKNRTLATSLYTIGICCILNSRTKG